jgi:hypothetical protein
MQVFSLLHLVVLALPLAACTGMKPIPEWAMHSRAVNEGEVQARRPATKVNVKLAHKPNDGRRLHSRQTSISPKRTDAPAPSEILSPPIDDLIPFTKQWYEREELRDGLLRARIRICSAC